MSRIGKQPIKIDSRVTVTIENGGSFGGQIVTVKGPKGELKQDIRSSILVRQDDNMIVLERKGNSKKSKSFHGLYRSLIENMLIGVVDGFKKTLELHGVGYRAKNVGNDIELTLGLNHPVQFQVPEGITAKVEKDDITVTGIDKQLVGETAARLRELKKPEPYKGKGIRYQGEYVRRKVGKSAATA